MTRGLACISLLYLLVAGAYALTVPLWEAPDEPAHFFYAQQMLDTSRPPTPTGPQPSPYWRDGYVTSGYEWHQPPTYYLVASGLLALSRQLNLLPTHRGYPEINPNFPLAQSALFVAHARQSHEAYVLRLFSVLCGLGTVWATSALARYSFPRVNMLPELAAGLVAFMPQFTFINSYVTNDGLAICTAALALAAIFRAGRRLPAAALPAWLLAGVATALALTVKMTSWFLVPIGLLWLTASFWGSIRNHKPAVASGPRLATWGSYLGIVLVSPLLIWLCWPGWTSQWLVDPSRRINPAYLNISYVLGLWPLTHVSFWGCFGWVIVWLPTWMLRIFDAALVVGLVAASVALARGWSRLSSATRWAVLVLVTTMALVLGQFLLFNFTVQQPQGRLLFPALPALAVLMGYGWLALAGRRSGPVGLALLVLWFTLDVWALVGVLIPAYAH
jgi:4-amino-4-deoxy-L-arabinose transferase-like glycosyltransferase